MAWVNQIRASGNRWDISNISRNAALAACCIADKRRIGQEALHVGYRRLFPVIDEKSVQLALQGRFVDVPTPGGIGKPELFRQGRGGMAVWGSFGVASEIEELGHGKDGGRETAQTANAVPASGPRRRVHLQRILGLCRGTGSAAIRSLTRALIRRYSG